MSILRCVIIGGRHRALGEGGEGHGIVGLGLGVGDSQLDRAEARQGLAAPGRRRACLRARCRSRAIFTMRCG